MNTCNQCGKPILWAMLPQHKWVALEPESDPRGTHAMLSDDRAVMLSTEQRIRATSDVRGRLHFAHNDLCDRLATLTATRVSEQREQKRAVKLRREQWR